jgi:hypothetical protein
MFSQKKKKKKFKPDKMKGKDTKPDVHKTHTSIVLCHEK